MSRRKPDVSRRIRPSQALKAAGERGLPPRMAADPETGVPMPDFLREPEPEVFQAPEPSKPEPSGPETPEPETSEPETPEPEVDDRTLGEVLGVLPDLPAGPPPGVMSDLPFPGQTAAEEVPDAQPVAQPAAQPAPGVHAAVSAPAVVERRQPDSERHPAGVPGAADRAVAARGAVTRYVQRITVTEAYRFDGHVQSAPAWIDRNWLSHDDESRYSHGSGVVLDIPQVGLVRVGDYVVTQDVLLDGTGLSASRVAVYRGDEFERFFIAVPV
jgi:hypothetical protein